MTSLEEAKELLSRIKEALSVMRRSDSFQTDIQESEVKFRYDAITGMLIIALGNIRDLCNEWESYENGEKL